MQAAWLIMILAHATGCGRIGFDPLGSGGDGPLSGDGNGMNGDGAGGDGGPADGMADAAFTPPPPGGENCASAVALPVGTSGTTTFSAAANDLTPLCNAGGLEVVYRVTVTGTQNLQLYLRPTFNSVMSVARNCPPAGGSCQTVLMNQTYDQSVQFQNGVSYVTIDKTGGSGISYELKLQ